MRVLVIGAGGKLGSRLLPALLAHSHTVFAFVRSQSKLESLLPPALLEKITIISGDAEDIPTVKSALLEHGIDILICTAGSPSALDGSGPPSRQGHISASIAHAAVQAGRERKNPVKGWWVTGVVLLDIPGRLPGEIWLDHIPNLRPEHRLTASTLYSIPTTELGWTILCPSGMTPRSTALTYSVEVGNEIVFGANYAPYFELGGKGELPPPMRARLGDDEMGKEIGALVTEHTAIMEDIADRLAEELEKPTGDWVGKKVGLKYVPGTTVKAI